MNDDAGQGSREREREGQLPYLVSLSSGREEQLRVTSGHLN